MKYISSEVTHSVMKYYTVIIELTLYTDGLVQDCGISSALALDIL